MRRLGLIFSAILLAVGFASLATLSVSAETSEPTGTFISQGSVADPNSPEVEAERADIAEEERLPDYSQVVDNATSGRFSATGWTKHSGEWATSEGQKSHGGSYVTSGSGSTPARFEVSIPTSNDYTVYAWWPAFSNNSDAARFTINTASGAQWTEVDQTRDGGIWIKLGTYAMEKGERYIRVSPDSSGVTTAVADAVAVVRGDVTAPPDEGGTTSSSSSSSSDTTFSGDATFSATSASNPTRHDVIRVAKHYIGTPYKWGTCTQYRMSCTCETKKTYAHFGHTLTMSEWGQWRYERSKRIWRRSNLKIGDHVFFKEQGAGGGITHVAIFSGNGNVVHASSYYGKVVESKMRYIRGYYGAKRYVLH